MERDDRGRRWAEPYLLRLPPARLQGDSNDLRCPEHPDVAYARLLGRVWVCPSCVRSAVQRRGRDH
ncbi:hypothetical protein [Streptomyces ochraceiscleroticus]|uniref:Uncharacterized protein n=1 Tax=Streptomyces ochraceiscleroticus TaxID=47761 RepID=A0ABW1MKM8_9ACTN|nr:hypothetical protein [Streptomyces ochraceiscleroticus]